MTEKRKLASLILMAICMICAAANAFGFTVPVPGSLGYDFYDFANQLSTGAPAYTIGMGGIAMGGFFLFKQMIWPAIGAGMGTIAILKSTNIVQSMGYIFS